MFLNREEAGIRLALLLSREKLRNAIIVAIPRGGVIVGKAVSEILKARLRVLIVKKISTPQNPELAIGAVGSLAIVFWDKNLINRIGISEKEKEKAFRQTVKTIKIREKSLGIKAPVVRGKTSVVIDDGVATGATAIAASMILKKLGSQKIILATPVISKNTKKKLEKYFDKIISVETPHDFQAVGQFYKEFPQIADQEVRKTLNSK